MKRKFKTIDLFAGIGGIRRGYELSGGFENVLSAEIDKYACQTYEHLYGENPENDVTSEDFKRKVENTEYDTLLAGFPCQAFSRAGKQEGFMDETRGTLFFDVADIIKRTRPKTFMLENVDNLLSHDKGHTFETIINVLVKELNYKIIGVSLDNDGKPCYSRESFLRNSRNFGVPQNRPRVYIMGFNRDYFGEKVEVLENKSLPINRPGEPIYEDLHGLIEHNVDPNFYLASGYLDTLKNHKARHQGKGNGFGYIVVNESENEHPISNAILATGGSGKERNLIFDPNPEIVGMEVKGKKTPINDEGIRFMTPIEWGKLQGFINYAFINEDGVDEFSLPEKLSKAQAYKQFGNSVTVPAIEQMALFMKACIEEMENLGE